MARAGLVAQGRVPGPAGRDPGCPPDLLEARAHPPPLQLARAGPHRAPFPRWWSAAGRLQSCQQAREGACVEIIRYADESGVRVGVQEADGVASPVPALADLLALRRRLRVVVASAAAVAPQPGPPPANRRWTGRPRLGRRASPTSGPAWRARSRVRSPTSMPGLTMPTCRSRRTARPGGGARCRRAHRHPAGLAGQRARARAGRGLQRRRRDRRRDHLQRRAVPVHRGRDPLYLPQGEVYICARALGPGIVPAWEALRPAGALQSAWRCAAAAAWPGTAGRPPRSCIADLAHLADYLFRARQGTRRRGDRPPGPAWSRSRTSPWSRRRWRASTSPASRYSLTNIVACDR